MKYLFLILLILIAGCIPIEPVKKEIPWQNLSEVYTPDIPKDCQINVNMSPAVMCSNWAKRYFWVHGYPHSKNFVYAYYGLDVNQSWWDKWEWTRDQIDNVTLDFRCQYQWAKRHGKIYQEYSFTLSTTQFESMMFNSTDLPLIIEKHYYHICSSWK